MATHHTRIIGHLAALEADFDELRAASLLVKSVASETFGLATT